MASDRTLHVSIVTPQTTAFDGSAHAVSVPGSQSPFQVLYNHAPIISSLDAGIIKIQDPSNAITYFASREGFVEVLKNNVNIVVNELLEASTIDLAKAEADLATARESADSHSDRSAREVARKELHWAEARIRAAKLIRE
ncbi:MAG: ATP synthase F1 subunit epsilon [bacterium]|nr:ATP synthase F1 subunit epsilon [bacterium]